MKNYHDITLALAGIVQAVCLVNDLATHGHCDEASFNSSVASIFKIDSSSVVDIYGTTQGLHYGLVQLERFLGSGDKPFPKISSQYFLGLLFLQQKLVKDQAITELLKERVQQARQHSQLLESFSSEIIQQLATTYADTIGQFSPRIIVRGKEHILSSEDIIFKIRALLLSGIRATILWRQLNGNRWQIIFTRKRILTACKHFLLD